MSVIDRSQDARQSVGPIGKRRRLVVWTSRRGTHLGSGHVRPRQQTGHMIASDRIHTNKLLQPGGRPHMGPGFRRDDVDFVICTYPTPRLKPILQSCLRYSISCHFSSSDSAVPKSCPVLLLPVWTSEPLTTSLPSLKGDSSVT